MRHLLLYFLLLFPLLLFAQSGAEGKYTVDANYFYGNIVPHRKSIQHLITGHPEGVVISFNRKTFGEKEWESAYNYPDWGFSFHYEDMKNQSLGEMYGLYGHYNFYFLKRNLVFRIGQGIAYNTNPYDKETNFRNYAYGASVMPTTYFMLNYSKQDLWQGIGVQAGLSFIHHSNASMKSPNTSTNTFAVNVGLNYTFDKNENRTYIARHQDSIPYKEPIRYNIAFRGGVNENNVIGGEQYPYYAVSFYADKRWSRKSAFQLGVDFFWPKYLEGYIEFKSVAFPEENVDPDTDYRKVGVFAGHELFINNLSLEAQAGVYVYEPFKSTGSLYQRVGMKYYFGKKIFGGISLKTHAARAEVLEFSMGIRL
ncbi:acyloxyacyl hydrolase [Flavobacterium salilacus subsp. salilacus]|uniref:acyloxyacyl hydrolase n=1 Tax=Flavobacterium TaxID=237 RepID=UPI001074FE39|nr:MULTISPECIES: acyloxyacyl hydrolase [Flavobacterium]KAF2519917.1 acyloxyacyl hydrolase [Flavobacterium salilacus subsp. salilacus]MBE1614173.1 acyloxyacyl hydrolase [Flavobacterium sp. SaA2.13]